MLKIESLTLAHVELFVEHLARHFPERGVGGIITQPFGANDPIDTAAIRNRTQSRLANLPGEGEWEVVWGLFHEGKIVGHVDLIGIPIKALRHRAKLGLGIEQKYRSQGFGRKLLSEALSWARSQEFLQWMDLDVFAHNKPARKLYESFGFQMTGVTPDRIRVDGESIDDCHYILNLKT